MKYLMVFFMIFSIVSVADDDMGEYGHYYSKDMEYLKLTKKQKKRVKDILKSYREDLKKLRRYKRDIIEQKKRLFVAKKLDKKKMYDLSLKLNKITSKIEERFMEDLHSVLTKEQRRRFVLYLDEWEIE